MAAKQIKNARAHARTHGAHKRRSICVRQARVQALLPLVQGQHDRKVSNKKTHRQLRARLRVGLLVSRTCVSLLARNGVWAPRRPRARMHSLSARSDLLISAPSILAGSHCGLHVR